MKSGEANLQVGGTDNQPCVRVGIAKIVVTIVNDLISTVAVQNEKVPVRAETETIVVFNGVTPIKQQKSFREDGLQR